MTFFDKIKLKKVLKMNINKLRQKLCLMFSIDNVNKMLLYSIINDEFLNFLEEINFENIPNLCDIVYKKELEIIKKLSKLETMITL